MTCEKTQKKKKFGIQRTLMKITIGILSPIHFSYKNNYLFTHFWHIPWYYSTYSMKEVFELQDVKFNSK